MAPPEPIAEADVTRRACVAEISRALLDARGSVPALLDAVLAPLARSIGGAVVARLDEPSATRGIADGPAALASVAERLLCGEPDPFGHLRDAALAGEGRRVSLALATPDDLRAFAAPE